MDPFLARTMVETLSKGINPITGYVLSKNELRSKLGGGYIESFEDMDVNEECMVNARALRAKLSAPASFFV